MPDLQKRKDAVSGVPRRKAAWILYAIESGDTKEKVARRYRVTEKVVDAVVSEFYRRAGV